MLSLHHVSHSLPLLRCRPIASSSQQQHEQHQQHIASNRIRVLSFAQHSPLLRRAHHYHHPRLVVAVAAGAATEEEGGGSGRRRRRRGVRMAAASTSPQNTGTAESTISFEPPGKGEKRTPLEMTHLEVCVCVCVCLSLSLSEMSLKNLVCRREEERCRSGDESCTKSPSLSLCVI
jgi:hypothetical protein